MATTFPESTQTFPRMMDIEQSDLQLVNQYQTAMKNEDYALARQFQTMRERLFKQTISMI